MADHEYDGTLINFLDRYNYLKETTGKTDPCIEELLEGL